MRIAVSRSPGCSDVSLVMSMPGPMKNSSAGTTRSLSPFLITNDASSAISAGAVSDGFTATQRSALKIACSRLIAVGVSA